LAISHAGLIANLDALGRQNVPQPVEVRVEANARYAFVADVLTAARNAAVSRISIASAVE
jgi:biopolymer transport protein ExbD